MTPKDIKDSLRIYRKQMKKNTNLNNRIMNN